MAVRRHSDRAGPGPRGQGGAFSRRAVGSGSQETIGRSEESGHKSQAVGEGDDHGLKGHFICR